MFNRSFHLGTLLCLCLLGCASPSSEPFRVPGESHLIISGVEVTGKIHLISEADVQKIVKAVQAARVIDHHVLSIRVISANEVQATTGVVEGPLSGRGSIVIIRREQGGWKWHDDGTLRVWNL